MAFLTSETKVIDLPKNRTRSLHTLSTALFSWRRKDTFTSFDTVLLTFWALLVATTLPLHEKWCDEAQAWLIARDSSAYGLIRHRLHYEGAPPLWHLLLHAFHLVHGTYSQIGWLGAAFAFAGVFVWLRWSPFPLILRALLPFTFFFVYQYAVIARSYCLFALLAFSLCALLVRKVHPLWFALVAGLLANLCVQGFLFSLVLIALYLHRLHRQSALRPQIRRLSAASALFAVFAAIAAYTALPAPDGNFAAAGPVRDSAAHQLLVRYIGVTPPFYPAPAADTYLYPDPEPAKPSLLSHPALWTAWQVNHRDIIDPEGHLGPQSIFSAALEFFLGLASQATWPIANSNLLACLFFITLILWLKALAGLRFLFLWIILLLDGQVLWVADQHAGMLLIALVAAIWLAAESPRINHINPALHRSFVFLFALVLALQCGWSWASISNDRQANYDPGHETAQWLHPWLASHPSARVAAFSFFSVSLQPYFQRNPFLNIPSSYWQWSWSGDPDPDHARVIARHPDLVLLTAEFQGPGQMRNQWAPLSRIFSPRQELLLPRDRIAADLRAHGYRETHRFCGDRFARFSFSYRDCDILFEPDPNFVPSQATLAADEETLYPDEIQ